MAKPFLVVLLLLNLALPRSVAASGAVQGKPRAETPRAKAGVIDLRAWDFQRDGTIFLDGEWELYWQRFPNPGTIDALGLTPEYFDMPRHWNGSSIAVGDRAGEVRGGDGYATFRLKVLLPTTRDSAAAAAAGYAGAGLPLSLKIKDVQTAWALYDQGRLLAATGQVGTRASESKPSGSSKIVDLRVDGDMLDLVIQVSNFHHRKGGIWEHVILGLEDDLRSAADYRMFFDIFLVGSIFIFGLYHLNLFYQLRQDKPSLFFGLFCLAIAVRALTTGEFYLYRLATGGSWFIFHRLEYLSFYMGLPLFMSYLAACFPKQFHKPVLPIIWIIAAGTSAAVIALPARLYSHTVLPYQIFTLLTGVYAIALLIYALWKRQEGAGILLGGFLVLFLTVVNDVFYSNQVIETGYFLPFGLLAFTFSQAYLITLRSTRTYHQAQTQAKELMAANAAYRNELTERIKLQENLVQSYAQFERSRIGIIMGLAKLAEYRDEDTGWHLERIREYSKLIAQELAQHPHYRRYITPSYIQDLYHSAILHDIGKVGVPDAILLKPAKLTAEEFKIIQRHPVIGGEAIMNVEKKMEIQSFLSLGREVAFSHHEKWDGSGYPKGLKGDAIPLSARIIALADVYDALTSARPYKPAFSHAKALGIIREGKGTHFDPLIVTCFEAVQDKFDNIAMHYEVLERT